jgi:hypothetical protein
LSSAKANKVLAWLLPRLKHNWLRVAGMTPITVVALRLPDSQWLKCLAVLVLVGMTLAKPKPRVNE